MKKKMGKRIGAVAMAILMVVGIMPTDWAVKKASAATETKEYVLEAKDLTSFAAGAKADGDEEKAGTDSFFTLVYSAKTKVDSSTKTFDDGYESSQRINLGGKATTEKNAVKFTTEGKAAVTVWWVEGGDDNRQMAILGSDGSQVAVTDVTLAKNATCISTFQLNEAGTYYLGGATNNNYIFKVEVKDEVEVVPQYEDVTSTFEASTLTSFAAGAKADGDEENIGTDGIFTVIYSAKSKVDSSTKTFDDGYESSQRLNLGGKATTEKNAVKITAPSAGTVTVWWVEGGDDNRQMAILDKDGNPVVTTSETLAKNATCISTLNIPEAGTYYLGGATNNNYIFKVTFKYQKEVSGGEVKPARKAWSEVSAPEITSLVQNEGNIEATANAVVGYDGADKVTVYMTDAKGNESKLMSSAEGDTVKKIFTPDATGTYSFKAVISRDGEEDKVSGAKTIDYVLPLATPSISSATSKGNGSVAVVINPVAEATSYNVYANGAKVATTTSTECMVTGLTVGTKYTFTVEAVRALPVATSSQSAGVNVTVTADAQQTWSVSRYGSSVDTKNNGVIGSVNDGSVTIYSENGKGKVVPASCDGLTFYYATVPTSKSFSISGKIHVDSWKLSNGQEGFGLMVSDTVGIDGDGTTLWNNSIQALASKIEYFYDQETQAVTTDTSKDKISMKMGIGINVKTGVTAQDVADITAGKIAAAPTSTDPAKKYFYTKTLETSAAANGAGTYNCVGNGSEGEGVTDLYFSIEEIVDNGEVGYIVTYMDANKTVLGSETVMGQMNLIDSENKYVGFFASRNARITVTDVNFELRDSVREVIVEDTAVVPNYNITSAGNANSENYTLTYKSDVNGIVVITAADGTVVADQAVVANTTYKFPTTLALGTNTFTVVSTPEAGFRPSAHEVLTSYESVTQEFKVTLNGFDGSVIYVGPNADQYGIGTKESPIDIYSAVKYAKAGQKIIILEGTYNLESTVKVARGIDGTAENMIYLIADPDAATRPVFDFGKNDCEGMVFGGNYWYISGFDVTNSGNSKDGARLCGNYNVVDNCNFYHNGNTGLQISAYNNSNDAREDWPSYNLVLNCTSYGNADKGYEDADGFAAKLTCGDGNVFDGCIAYNNADDGWDLFAKMQTGSIGSVTIKNSVAYGNGYLEDGTNAGNGNGFKMGGDSMTGYHKLINCVAFDNKAKGIDSNSCPDIQVENCISFNNESYNVALYTNTAVNTDFSAKGIVSFKTSNDVSEQFKFKGTQDASKVYNASNYFWNCTENGTNNANGLVKADWFVSIDTKMNHETHVYSDRVVTRNADGTVNMNGLLQLTAAKETELGFHSGIGAGQASHKLGEVLSDSDVVTSGLTIKPKKPSVASDQVNTGDVSNVFILLIMMFAALGCGVCVFDKKRKNA
ncbi:MAG: hypothetical protein ACI4D4_10115 [Lachnospira sp.]